jgi:hypothetical protein
MLWLLRQLLPDARLLRDQGTYEVTAAVPAPFGLSA